MYEITRVIDVVTRKHSPISNPGVFDTPGMAETLEAYVTRQALPQRSASADLGISCYGVTVLPDSLVKRVLAGEGEALWDSGADSIKTSQIMDPHGRCGLVAEDANLRYQQAAASKRAAASEDERRRAGLLMAQTLGAFARAVVALVRSTVDGMHTTQKPLPQGILYEDAVVKVQFVADYQAGAGDDADEAGRAWLQQELQASRWINAQDAVDAYCSLMVGAEYKGFQAMAVAKLPLCPQKTLVFDLQDDDPIVGEAVLGVMRALARELHVLAAYPWRLGDGRTIQMALHPALQVHHIQASTLAAASGSVLIVGKQAGKITGGGAAAASTLTPVGYYLLNVGELLPQWPGEQFPTLGAVRPELLARSHGAAGPGAVHPEATLGAVGGLLADALDTLARDLEALAVLPLDSLEWTELLHARGLSSALLGALAERARLPHIQEALQIEMLARTLNQAIRAQLRQTILHFRDVQALLVEEELAAIAVSTVNTLLGGAAPGGREWKGELVRAAAAKYAYPRMDMDVLRGLSPTALFVAIQHHCGLQFRPEALRAVRAGTPIEPRDFVRFLAKTDLPYAPAPAAPPADEEEVRRALAGRLLARREGLLFSAALAADFEQLALLQRCPTAMALARGTCPPTHARVASLLLSELELQPEAALGLRAASDAYERALQQARTHLGDHHPYQLLVAERYTRLLQTRVGDEPALREALRVRQQLLADSAKILGKTHARTRAHFYEIGELQLQLGDYDRAIDSYATALQQTPLPLAQHIALLMRLGQCEQAKDDIEAALAHVRACRSLVERELPRHAGSQRAELLLRQAETLERMARLSQAVHQQHGAGPADGSGGALMVSADMERHLTTAIECYERLFELQRSAPDGDRLVDLLQAILGLKLQLAPPAAKPVIALLARQPAADDAARLARDLVGRLVSGSVAPSAFMDQLLGRIAGAETMRDAEPELRAVIAFTSQAT